MRMGRKLITHMVCIFFILSIFQNVSAADRVYTIDDNNSNISTYTEEGFTVSLKSPSIYQWKLVSHDSSILKLMNEDIWAYGTNPGNSALYNWTFMGKHTGTLILRFNMEILGDTTHTIYDSFFLNVTVIQGESVDISLILLVVAVIAVIPSAIIIKWMKGKKDI